MNLSALKIIAESTELVGVARCMTFSTLGTGYSAANMAGMMAKYLETSLATLNVVSASPVINICLPVSTISSSLAGLESRSTMLAASLAALAVARYLPTNWNKEFFGMSEIVVFGNAYTVFKFYGKMA